jgi:hypothetical protein
LGIGIYSGDFAMDLRSTIRAVSRLPFDADKLADIIRETETSAAENPKDEDHTTFWLVLADQFRKRGIHSESVRTKALEIVDGGSDIAMLESLGLRSADISKRKKVLNELRERLAQPPISRPRPTLKNPQPYVMDIGDVLIYPTWKGDSVNPYMPKEHEGKMDVNDGWGVIVIVDRGRAFDFLTWYRPLTSVYSFAERPTTEALRGDLLWRQSRAGTCTRTHFKRLKFELIGRLSIDLQKMQNELADVRPGISAAVNDISIANQMETAPRFNIKFLANQGEDPKGRYLSLRGINRILTA